MSAGVWALVVATLVVAGIDWYAVGVANRGLEYAAKPATMVLLFLVGVALVPHHVDVQTWFLIAVVCSLAGDVFLMLPQDLFVFGLGSFLLGHLAYIVGMQLDGTERPALLVGVVVVAVAMVVLGRPIVAAVGRSERALLGPVIVYMLVISAMVASAFGTTRPLAIAGASLFYASDALIAWNRFIDEKSWGRMAIITTYHLGQLGLILSLAR